MSLLPTTAASIYTIAIYACKVRGIRYTYVLCNFIWLLYNVYVFSIVGIITQLMLVASGVIAIIRYRKGKIVNRASKSK